MIKKNEKSHQITEVKWNEFINKRHHQLDKITNSIFLLNQLKLSSNTDYLLIFIREISDTKFSKNNHF